MILWIGNHKGSTKRLVELIKEFGEVAGYKVNIKKKISCMSPTLTANYLKEKTISLTIESKIIKYLGINLTKEVKNLCTDERNRRRHR